MKTKYIAFTLVSIVCTMLAGCTAFQFADSKHETLLSFPADNQKNRTANMCGPTHDEEMIYGLGSDGKKHYFAVGTDVRGPGITIWQSDDLVTWKDVGRVFNQNNMPSIFNGAYRYAFNSVSVNDKGEYEFANTHAAGANNYRIGGGNPYWAPCIYFNKNDENYYLYYSCSAYGTRNSFIGCAKSKTLDKGWIDCGQLIHTRTGDGKRFNAIDPVVVNDKDGHPWMAYGSFFGGISIVELNPQDPSKLKNPGTHGKTIHSRDDYDRTPYEQDGFEGHKTRSTNGEQFTVYGQEGSSIVYNPDTDYYYLFSGYDRLAWTYHTRVGRSKNIDGPYIDYNGNPMIYKQEQIAPKVYGTKILGPYQWQSIHAGWGATAHTTLFYTADGNLMFGSNSKERVNGTSFVGLRKVLWTDDGWPVVTPCLYGGENFTASLDVPEKAITGEADSAVWDFIVFSVDDDTKFNRTDASKSYTLQSNGKIDKGNGFWKYLPDTKNAGMNITLPDGTKAKGKLALGWDQDRKQQTVVFSGLTQDGVSVWGQRTTPSAVALQK